jgi:hypothetical protein
MILKIKRRKDLTLDQTNLTFEKIEKKMRLAAGLFQMAFEVKKFQLRKKFPELSEIELNHRAYALIEQGCR